jgi:hypothetical protein
MAGLKTRLYGIVKTAVVSRLGDGREVVWSYSSRT